MTFIYADNNATTRIAPEAIEAMQPFLTELWGNPSSTYPFGAEVARHLEKAREHVAKLIGARRQSEIIFTSSGTESDCTSIWSALKQSKEKRHIVTTQVEHPAILNLCHFLEKSGEAEVTFLAVNGSGRLDLDLLANAIRRDTALVTTMWANNETGVIFPIPEIAQLCAERGVPLHVDAVQAAGKIPIDVASSPITSLALSAHKIHGPKGIGALYVRRGTPFSPLFLGTQELNRRAGTENVAGIAGFGVAAELALTELLKDTGRLERLKQRFEQGLLAHFPKAVINGQGAPRLPNTTNISFAGIGADTLLILLGQRGVCASTGSACSSGSLEPSHVLKAMGVSSERLQSAIRFSLSRETTDQEVEELLSIVVSAARSLSRE